VPLIKYYKSSDREISVICGRGVSKKFPMHRHISFSFGTIVKGCRLLTLNKNQYVLGPGDIFVINPEEPHSISENKDTEHDYIVISMACDLVYQTLDKIFFRNIFHNSVTCEFLGTLFDSIIEDKKLNYEWTDFERFLLELKPFSTTQKLAEHESHLLKVREILDKEHINNYSTTELAEKAFLSPFHFNRKFKKLTGLAPHQYLLDNRLRFARTMIEKGLSINDIAIAAGFYDSSHFVRHFVNHYGVTPQSFQKGMNNLLL
jgi:AraC-like DNA-binding protein